jgi:heme oxygenase
MAGARDHLRDATAQIHESLHGAAPFARIAAGAMDRGGYAALLLFLYRYHACMAEICSLGAARLQAPALAAAQRARLVALRADLAVFGCHPGGARGAPQGNADFAVGCLYTVQGSTLGGKLIHRQLAELLPDGAGRSFFAGTSEDGAQWKFFCHRLEEAGLDLAQLEAGALHAFDRFRVMLDESELAVACQ